MRRLYLAIAASAALWIIPAAPASARCDLPDAAEAAQAMQLSQVRAGERERVRPLMRRDATEERREPRLAVPRAASPACAEDDAACRARRTVQPPAQSPPARTGAGTTIPDSILLRHRQFL
ncbi:MAG: hypothetical protein AB7T08_04615 [Hyphomonadaceae bacterium]